MRSSSTMPDEPGAAVRAGSRIGVSYALLGPLEVRKDGTNHAPTAPKLLQLLAMLLTRPGDIVPVDAVVEELWGARPPSSVRTTVQTYVYQLRRSFERHGLAAGGADLLVTRQPGYVFRIAPEQTDAFHFHRLSRRGQTLLDERRYGEAAAALRAALALWSGPALANVTCGPLLSAYAVDLAEQRRSARQLRIQAEIEDGGHRELIGELRSMTAENPLDEGMHGQLMRALGRSGRRSEAMATYRELRHRLRSELGVEPCDELQLLHNELLSTGRPGPAAPAPSPEAHGSARR